MTFRCFNMRTTVRTLFLLAVLVASASGAIAGGRRTKEVPGIFPVNQRSLQILRRLKRTHFTWSGKEAFRSSIYSSGDETQTPSLKLPFSIFKYLTGEKIFGNFEPDPNGPPLPPQPSAGQSKRDTNDDDENGEDPNGAPLPSQPTLSQENAGLSKPEDLSGLKEKFPSNYWRKRPHPLASYDHLHIHVGQPGPSFLHRLLSTLGLKPGDFPSIDIPCAGGESLNFTLEERPPPPQPPKPPQTFPEENSGGHLGFRCPDALMHDNEDFPSFCYDVIDEQGACLMDDIILSEDACIQSFGQDFYDKQLALQRQLEANRTTVQDASASSTTTAAPTASAVNDPAAPVFPEDEDEEATSSPVERREATSSPVERREATSSPGERREATSSPGERREATSSPVERREATSSPGERREATSSPGERREATSSPVERREATSSPVERREATSSPGERREARRPRSEARDEYDGPIFNHGVLEMLGFLNMVDEVQPTPMGQHIGRGR